VTLRTDVADPSRVDGRVPVIEEGGAALDPVGGDGV